MLTAAATPALTCRSDFNLLTYVVKSRALGALGGSSDAEKLVAAVSKQDGVPKAEDDRLRAALSPAGTGGFGGGGGGGGGGSAIFGGGGGGGGEGGGGQWATQAEQLVQMGFERAAATAVLEAVNGNLEQAIGFLAS